MSELLRVLSMVVGWLYFWAWSISFYPQVWMNYKLSNVTGFSFNFGVLNWTGFLTYSLYSIWGYIDPGIMPGTVKVQDIAFAVHAFVLTTVILAQCVHYDDLYKRTDLWVKGLTTTLLLFGAACAALQFAGVMPQHKD